MRTYDPNKAYNPTFTEMECLMQWLLGAWAGACLFVKGWHDLEWGCYGAKEWHERYA